MLMGGQGCVHSQKSRFLLHCKQSADSVGKSAQILGGILAMEQALNCKLQHSNNDFSLLAKKRALS